MNTKTTERVTPKDFINKAEKMARQEAPKKGLTVWSGSFSGFIYPYDRVFHCVVVGLKEESDSPPSLSLAVLSACVEGEGVTIESDKESEYCPFGGGWNPLEQFRKYLEDLPNFS